MKLRQILDEEQLSKGFTSENDIFQLGDLAARLTSLLTALSQGSVSVLDGRWGSGKTTFVKMWVGDLQLKGLPAIYFDAFKMDYISDPFQAVSSVFVKAAVERKLTERAAYKQFLKRAGAVGKRVAGISAKAGMRLATLGLVGASELEALAELKDELADAAGDAGEEAVKALLEQHAGDEAVFEELRKSLLDLPALLKPAGVASRSTDGALPLIVVIDELDRCRPDFALGILEVLKHFFRIDGLHFVLVTNMNHLSLSVSKRYGLSSASDEYLQKFYDFVVHFEHGYDRYDQGSVTAYASRVLRSLMREGAATEDRRYIEEHVRQIAKAYRLTLRQIEAVVTNVALAFLAAPPKEYRPAIILAMLCTLKTLRPAIFVSAKIGQFDYQGFEEFIRFGRWDKDVDVSRLLRVFRYHSDPNLNENDPEFEGYGRELWHYNFDRLGVLPYIANSVVDRFGGPASPSEL
jgi:hypothetical protein